jgi:hypothetical protein
MSRCANEQKRIGSNVDSGGSYPGWPPLLVECLFEPPQEYGALSVTLTGQHVRSKGERVIADYFTRHGIPYYYEGMATTNDWFIFKSKIGRLDFYLPQYTAVVWTSF